MSKAVFSVKVDRELLDEAAAALECEGLTVDEVFQQLLAYVAAKRQPPSFDCFAPGDCFVPGPKTMAAMAELERGETVAFSSIDGLMAHLKGVGMANDNPVRFCQVDLNQRG